MSISNCNAANTMTGLFQIRRQIAALTIEDGPPLSAQERALVKLGLAASVTSLNTHAIDSAIQEAFDAGATPGEIQEVVSVVSGLGVHSLMVTATAILSRARLAGYDIDAPLTEFEAAKWAARVGEDPFGPRWKMNCPDFCARCCDFRHSNSMPSSIIALYPGRAAWFARGSRSFWPWQVMQPPRICSCRASGCTLRMR